MRYSINGDLNNRFDVFSDNVLPGRAYFIPFRDRALMAGTDIRTERFSSDIVTVLDGDWDFKYYSNRQDLPTDFDTDAVSFDCVAIPSVWQSTGYEPPYYVNTRYPFKPAPPQVPDDAPVGVYRRRFDIDAADVTGEYILTFLGVAGAVEVYFNGEYVGYSECSHNTAEYNLTGRVCAGCNELLVVNHKWSNATYMECQDMFRCNGIFRDVLLTHTTGVSLWDYYADITANDDHTYDIRFDYELNADGRVVVQLCDGDNVVASAESSCERKSSVSLSSLNVDEWSAEIPRLYTLNITVMDDNGPVQYVSRPIGFKHIVIDGNVFRFNDRGIKLMGVNHHDTTSRNGYAMTVAEMERDVRIFKEYNVNCVRTSHYPPDPIFIDLCDEYGIYVVDEADIETHGCQVELHRPGALSHNPQWRDRYWDRVLRMYLRDRNHPAITMWSLGNEAHGYSNQDYCYDQLSKLSPIPIHYEAVCRTRRWAYDVVSQMYPWPSRVRKIAAGHGLPRKYYTKPYYMCEYAHAMGLGAGELDAYVDAFLNADNMMGGCIWEFCDHAIYHPDGRYRYTYGGDHGEQKHDGNFCVDGLFDPERRPHAGAISMRCCYRPIRATRNADGTITLTNINYFAPMSFTLRWSCYADSSLSADGEQTLSIDPRDSITIDIGCDTTDCSSCDIVLRYYDDTGRDIGCEQLTLSSGYADVGISTANAPTVAINESRLIISFDDGRIIYNKSTGFFESYVKGGREFIDPAPMGGNVGFGSTVFRAPLDNDMYSNRYWSKLRLDTETTSLHKRLNKNGYTISDGCVVIENIYSLRTIKRMAPVKTRMKFTIAGDGTMRVDFTAVSSPIILFTPRYGLTLEMPRQYHNVTYFGRGDRANTSDFCAHAMLGEYSTTVADMHEDFIKPQESSMRTDVRRAVITDDDGCGLEFLAAGHPFTFGADHYTSAQCAKATHREDLHYCDTTVVHLDAYMMGCGSNSCGPLPSPQYKTNRVKGISQSIIIRPILTK